MTQKALYLSHFTPSMMQPDTLQHMLVQRQPLIDACCDDVVHSVTTRAKHHYLFVGPRGIGKTHLISLLHHRLSTSKEIQERGLIAWMREEEWGVTSFFELVLRILRVLDQQVPALGIAAQTAPLYELTLKQAESQGTSLLLEVLGNKTLVVLMENLDDLFDQLGDAGQRQFRAFIQNHPQLVLVATTPSLFAGVSLQKSPFYGFFDIQALKELSLEDVVDLLKKIAVERGDSALAEFMETREARARIRAVHHLAEGNPRIYVILAQFLSREALDELVQAVMHTLDELTPYYQARMKELSGQQRKIVEYLVSYRGAAPVKQIAKACFITPQTCSGQLRQLREKRYVHSIEAGRESFYELTEPLMRLCMEVKQQRGEPVGLLVESLRIWYAEAELREGLDLAEGKREVDEHHGSGERIFNALAEPAVSAEFEKIVLRVMQAASAWKRTGDEKHLLVLPREERALAVNLKTD
jgi:DNA-binding transcriptional ArsR family regulator